jgi:acetyl-CoA carboxylase biotin carboxyl carrier protein
MAPGESLTFALDAVNVKLLLGKWKRPMNDKNRRPDEPEVTALGGKIDFDEVRRVIALLEEKNLSVFELEVEGFKIKINRNNPAPAVAPLIQAVTPVPAPADVSAPAAPVEHELDKTLQFVASPMVGTFYRAPDPTAAPFVDVGDPVKKGQTLCIVEAMKLMNEIESDLDGTIVEIFAENAKPVEFGQKLFAIKPLS